SFTSLSLSLPPHLLSTLFPYTTLFRSFSVQINNLFPYIYKKHQTTYNFSVTYNSSSITYKFAILIYKLPSHTYKKPLLSTMPAVSSVFFIPPKKIVQRITSILTDALDNLIDSIMFLDGMIEYIQVNLHIPKCQLLQHRRQPYMAGRSLTLFLIQLQKPPRSEERRVGKEYNSQNTRQNPRQ